MTAFFQIPLDLPHAGTIASRVAYRIEVCGESAGGDNRTLLAIVGDLERILEPYRESGENPAAAQGKQVAQDALGLARLAVDEIEKLAWGDDRLGQLVRNLFECLERGEEGAEISLRAGENPGSVQRP